MNREVNLLLNTTNENYQKNFRLKFKGKDYNYGGMRFVKEDEFNLFQEKLNKVHEEMNEYIQRKIDNSSDKEEKKVE